MSDELNRLSSWLRAQPSIELILAPFADAIASRRRVLVDCPRRQRRHRIDRAVNASSTRNYTAVTSGTKSVYVLYYEENFNCFRPEITASL